MNDNDSLFMSKDGGEKKEEEKTIDLELIELLEKFLAKAKEGNIGDFLMTYQDKGEETGSPFPLYMKVSDRPEGLNMACDYAKAEIMDYLRGYNMGEEME